MGFGGISSMRPHLSVPPLSDGGRTFRTNRRPYEKTYDSNLLPKRPQQIHWPHNRDALIFLESKQMSVAGNDQVRFSSKRTDENVIVIGIVRHDFQESIHSHPFRLSYQDFENVSRFLLPPQKTSPKNTGGFFHNRRRQDEAVLPFQEKLPHGGKRAF